MTKTHYDKFLNGIIHCGRQNYDSATDKVKEVTCKDCLRIIEDMKSVDWKKWIASSLRDYYKDAVSIKYDRQDNPTLIFKYEVTNNFKRQVIDLVELLYEELGGEVKFFLKKETKV